MRRSGISGFELALVSRARAHIVGTRGRPRGWRPDGKGRMSAGRGRPCDAARWLARRRRGSELSSGLQWRFTLRPLPLHACGIKPESRLYFPSLKHESASLLTRFSSSSLRHVAQKSSGRTIGPSNGYGNRQRSLSSRAQPPHRSTSCRATAPPSRHVSASPSLGRGLAPAAAAVPSPRPALHLAAARALA